MHNSGFGIFSDAKVNLLTAPHKGIVPVGVQEAKQRFIHHESIHIHPEKPLWIDTLANIAVLAGLFLPKLRQDDYAGRLILGFILGQTQRQRQYILAPFEEDGSLGHSTSLHHPIQHVVFGRHGLIKKAFHIPTNSEFISHTPDHHNDIQGIMSQVGEHTSPEHMQISFDSTLLRLRDTSEQGTLAFAA